MATGVAVLRTRVEIISTELEEQREWLEKIVILAVASLFCVSMALILLTFFIVMCFWESYRLWVLGGFSVLYLGGAVASVMLFRNKIKSKPRLFAATAEELAKDHAYLQPGNP